MRGYMLNEVKKIKVRTITVVVVIVVVFSWEQQVSNLFFINHFENLYCFLVFRMTKIPLSNICLRLKHFCLGTLSAFLKVIKDSKSFMLYG